MNEQPIITTLGELFVFLKEHLQLVLTKGKLEAVKDVSKAAAAIIMIMIGLGVVTTVLTLSSFAVILHLHTVGYSYLAALGFVLLGLLIIVILFYLLRNILFINPIIGFIIRNILN